MTDNLDQLKEQWRRLSVGGQRLDDANRRITDELTRRRVSTTQQRLAKRLRKYVILGLVLPVLAPTLYYVLECPLWFAILYGLFGILMMVANAFLVNYIREADLISMPVADAVRRAVNIRLWQTRIRIMGIACGAALLASLFFFIADRNEPGLIFAGIIGLAVGLSVSIPRCLKNMRLARRLEESLSEG